MRKLLTIILIILLCVLLWYAVMQGISISKMDINSFSQIRTANEKLDKSINEAKTLTSVDYPSKLGELEKTSEKLVKIREEYENKITYSSEEEMQKAKQLTEFEVDFLFAKLGTYVRKEGVKINIVYTPDSTGNGGNLHFVVVGKYIPITEFVRDIEDDERLYFSIENFRLSPREGDTVNLQAEFDVNAIKLNVDESIENPTVIINTTSNDTQENSTVKNNPTENNSTENNSTENNSTENNSTENNTAGNSTVESNTPT